MTGANSFLRPGLPIIGVPLATTDGAAYLLPGPVKDHFLLVTAGAASANPGERAKLLNLLIQQVDEQIPVLAHLGRTDRGQGVCWLMADGLFSHSDPQS
jgi:hypothetical protein